MTCRHKPVFEIRICEWTLTGETGPIGYGDMSGFMGEHMEDGWEPWHIVEKENPSSSRVWFKRKKPCPECQMKDTFGPNL